MSAHMELVEEGIAAYEAGNLSEARKLLAMAVKTTDRNNERAWLYLAKVQNDPEKRRQCLQMVLKINPDNAAVRDELQTLIEADNVQRTNVNELRNSVKSPSSSGASSASSASVRIPGGIPGAPDKFGLDDLQAFAPAFIQDSIAVLSGKAAELTAPLTWWQAILTVGVTGFVLGLLVDIQRIITALRFSSFGSILFSLITTPFIMALLALIAVGAGGFLSYWYLTGWRGGAASLLAHLGVMVKAWAPATLLLGILGIIEALTGGYVTTVVDLVRGGALYTGGLGLVLGLIAAGIAVYTMYIMVNGLRKLYSGISNNHYWIAAFIMIFVAALIIR